jgi:hypothetical protein
MSPEQGPFPTNIDPSRPFGAADRVLFPLARWRRQIKFDTADRPVAEGAISHFPFSSHLHERP